MLSSAFFSPVQMCEQFFEVDQPQKATDSVLPSLILVQSGFVIFIYFKIEGSIEMSKRVKNIYIKTDQR